MKIDKERLELVYKVMAACDDDKEMTHEETVARMREDANGEPE